MSPSQVKQKIASRAKQHNVGAYSQPFSGVGMQFEPLGAPVADTGFTLHETGYLAKSQTWNFPNVYSPFWRIYYDYGKGHYVRFEDELTPLGPDRVLVIPNHQRFDCVGDSVETLWIHFSCTRYVEPVQPMPIVIPANDMIKTFAKEFPLLFRSKKLDKTSLIFNLSLSFLIYILSQSQIRWQKPLPENVASVVEAINRSPAFPWTTANLAKHVAMSAQGFSRLFQRWMHTTPGRYVHQVRIREACRMLIESDDSIDSIALQVGFADRFHFSRIFKQLTNTTPARYRKLRLQSGL